MKNILTLPTKILSVFIFTTILIASASSYALTLDEIKSAGLVGERYDGLLGIVEPNTKGKDITKIKKFIDDINKQRMQKYKELSTESSINTKQIQLLTGEKVMNNAIPGTYIMPKNGWQRK